VLRHLWYQSLTLFVYFMQREQEEKENTLIHISLVSEEGRVLRLCGDCCRCATVKRQSGGLVGDAGSTQGCRVTTTGFPGGQTKGRKLATEGHRCDGKKNHQQLRKVEVDKELTEIRERMEILALQMQHNARSRWVYEWPMKRTKEKWPVRELVAKDSGGC
jgi:hypothetical protein